MDKNLKSKVLNLGLIISSLFGYLEWGTNNRSFLFQVEIEVFKQLFNNPQSVLHPLTLLPLIGQLLLTYTLFQKSPGKMFTFFGMGGLGVLLFLIFIVGIISKNLCITFSVLPFFTIGILAIIHHIKKNGKK